MISLDSPEFQAAVKAIIDEAFKQKGFISQETQSGDESNETKSTDRKTYQKEYQRKWREKHKDDPTYRERANISQKKWVASLMDKHPDKLQEMRQKTNEYISQTRSAFYKQRCEQRIPNLVKQIVPKLPSASKLGSLEEVCDKVSSLLNTYVKQDESADDSLTVFDVITSQASVKRSVDTIIKAAIYREDLKITNDFAMIPKACGLTPTVYTAIYDLNKILKAHNIDQ